MRFIIFVLFGGQQHLNKLNLFSFYPIGRASHDLVIVDDRQGKKVLFMNSIVKKHGVGWPPKTMRNSSIDNGW